MSTSIAEIEVAEFEGTCLAARKATDWIDKFLAQPAISDLIKELGEAEMSRLRGDIASAQYKLFESLVAYFSEIRFETLVVSDDGEPAIVKEVQPHHVYDQFCQFAETVVEGFGKSFGDVNVLESVVAPALLAALVPDERALLQELERPADDQFSYDPGWYEPIRAMESQLDGLWEDTIFRCVMDPRVRCNGDVFILPAWPRLLLAMRDEEIRCDFQQTVAQRIGLWALQFPPKAETHADRPMTKKKSGRPPISEDRKQEALDRYLAGKRNQAAAKALYGHYPTPNQRRSVPTILKRYIREHPDLSNLIVRFPALKTHPTASKWVEEASKNE